MTFWTVVFTMNSDSMDCVQIKTVPLIIKENNVELLLRERGVTMVSLEHTDTLQLHSAAFRL